MLHGLKNGTTTVYGQLGTTKMALGVHVEMVDSNVLLWENMVDLDDRWDIKASSTSWRTEMKTNAEGNACLYINYTGGRVAQLSFNADTLLYSTPKKLESIKKASSGLIGFPFIFSDPIFNKATDGFSFFKI